MMKTKQKQKNMYKLMEDIWNPRMVCDFFLPYNPYVCCVHVQLYFRFISFSIFFYSVPINCSLACGSRVKKSLLAVTHNKKNRNSYAFSFYIFDANVILLVIFCFMASKQFSSFEQKNEIDSIWMCYILAMHKENLVQSLSI